MVFSEKFGDKSFNLNVLEREACLKALFDHGAYEPSEDADASSVNMAARYLDIHDAFSEEITKDVLPFFLDWLREKVVLVEIIAYSEENAYTIFETMNDRGLNLTPTEMLKGFLLSRFKNDAKRNEANSLWKGLVDELNIYEKNEDLTFFQVFLRSKYAETIRPSKAGSVNEDFEKIGTRFHSWVRENLEKMGLSGNAESRFIELIFEEIKYYQKAYVRILEAKSHFTHELDNVFYIERWGIASSLSYPLLLAPIVKTDSQQCANEKINLVASYIDNFCVRRSVNFKTFSSSSIRYTMYNLVKEIRNQPIKRLRDILSEKISTMEQKLSGISGFRLHGQNRLFVKYFLSRLSGYVDVSSGKTTNFVDYFCASSGKPYEIEHLWADIYRRHRQEFEQQDEFREFRNRIGALVLLPKGTNQSYNDRTYEDKLRLYIRENLLASSLHPSAYQNNPNFNKFISQEALKFKPHEVMTRESIKERQELYLQLARKIWHFAAD